MIVPMTETKSEPRQPKRLEKKGEHSRYFALETSKTLTNVIIHCDTGQFPIAKVTTDRLSAFPSKHHTGKFGSVIVFRNFGKK
jgi:hypothetical protein